MTVATELRFQRIQDSIATNPNFTFGGPRTLLAYVEGIIPTMFFVDGRFPDRQLDLSVARGFFQNSRMPKGFFRANQSFDIDTQELVEDANLMFNAHPIKPGRNEGAGNYIPDPGLPQFSNFCGIYTNFVNVTVRTLYPNPTGALREAVTTNLEFLASSVNGTCPPVILFGQ